MCTVHTVPVHICMYCLNVYTQLLLCQAIRECTFFFFFFLLCYGTFTRSWIHIDARYLNKFKGLVHHTGDTSMARSKEESEIKT